MADKFGTSLGIAWLQNNEGAAFITIGKEGERGYVELTAAEVEWLIHELREQAPWRRLDVPAG